MNTVKITGRADLHIHTTTSDGLDSVQAILEAVCWRKNLDVIAITDHDRLDASLWAYERREQYPFEIIPGLEVSSAEGHVLGLWVTNPVPLGLSLAETAAAIHEQNGIAILAHPVAFTLAARASWSFLRNPASIASAGIDALEVHNAGSITPGGNRMARYISSQLDLAETGSSDAHMIDAVGKGVTHFPGHTAADLRHALETRQTEAHGASWPLTNYSRLGRVVLQNQLRNVSTGLRGLSRSTHV